MCLTQVCQLVHTTPRTHTHTHCTHTPHRMHTHTHCTHTPHAHTHTRAAANTQTLHTHADTHTTHTNTHTAHTHTHMHPPRTHTQVVRYSKQMEETLALASLLFFYFKVVFGIFNCIFCIHVVAFHVDRQIRLTIAPLSDGGQRDHGSRNKLLNENDIK